MILKNNLPLIVILTFLTLNFYFVQCRLRKHLNLEPNQDSNSRNGKLFPMISVVRFPNEACNGSSSLEGTCYTSEECSNKGGSGTGSCASGFGVCCVFSLACGATISENNTYLVQASTTSATNPNPCMYTICKCSSNICRIRLDFTTFNIAGPQTDTIVQTSTTANTGGGIGDCLTDSFVFSSPGHGSSPVICGFNTGQHMIVDASEDCNKAIFNLGGSGDTRQWDIKVTQYDCTDESAGPPGCLQYFTGTSGRVSNFNYPTSIGGGTTGSPTATTTHLSNQKYTMCFRREANKCAICYTTYDSGPGTATSGHSATDMASFGLRL